MPKQRTAFLIHGLVVGGAEKFFISLVNHFYRKGENPLVIMLSDHNPLFHEIDKGVQSIILERKYKYDLFIGKQIKQTLRENNAGQVFVVGMFSFFMLKLFFLFEKKIRVILSLHSTIPRDFKDYLVNLVYFRFFQRKDRVIFICKAQQDYLRKHYLFTPKQSQLIYNGINTDHFKLCKGTAAENNGLKQQLGIPADAKVIVKVARLFEEKGHNYAVDALDILHNKFNLPAHLLFVGSGDDEYEAKIRAYVQQKKLERHIHFIGHQADVRPYHCMADMFTLTSYTTETFSLAALEAMSSGIPCSLTEIGGAAEMINEKTGALSRNKDPHSIAESWKTVLEKNYDPVFLHDNVVRHFALPDMIDHYTAALNPELTSNPAA